jgi:hypothetical protein
VSTNVNGGALYCSSVTYLLVESTSFFSCKTSGRGGAIDFSISNNGQCILYKVCGYDCCSTTGTYSQFAYIGVRHLITHKNYANFSSIVCCVNEISTSRYTLYLDYGDICCQSVNISNNKCYQRTAIICFPFRDSNTITCSFSCCTFADNIAIEYSCIYFHQSGANYKIKSCNIIRNIQGSLSSEGTFYTNGFLRIEDSCILENTATYIFSVESTSYTITISNCTVDKTSNNGYLTIQNTVTKSFIHALNHMSTRNCHSEYDSAGTLAPNIQTPSSTKQMRCYTYIKYIYQPRLSDIFSFNSIFIFNFIHPC